MICVEKGFLVRSTRDKGGYHEKNRHLFTRLFLPECYAVLLFQARLYT